MPTPHAPQTRSAVVVAVDVTRWPGPQVDIAWHSRFEVGVAVLDSNSAVVQTSLCAHTRSVESLDRAAEATWRGAEEP